MKNPIPAFLLVCACAAGQQTMVLAPAADTCVYKNQRDQNFGSSETLDLYGDSRKVLMRFDLGAVPAPAAIVSARLSFTFQSVKAEFGVNPKRFFLYDLARNFVETEANWTQFAQGQAWSAEGLQKYEDYYALPWQSAALLATGPGEYTVDVTEMARRVRAAGGNSLAMVLFGTDRNPSGSIFSREYGDSAKRPRLEIQYSASMPLANAGADMFDGRALDGGRSALPDGSGSGLSYAWTIERAAPGSPYAAGEQVGDSATLAFNPAMPGWYVLRLRVTNPATGETGEDTAGFLTPPGQHPRLQINADLLAQIRGLRDSADITWGRFYNWVSGRVRVAPTALDGQAAMSLALAGLVTGDRQYVDTAWQFTCTRIYKNGKDRSGGLLRLIDFYKGDNHAAAFQGGVLIAQLAHVYDWGYALLTPERRHDLLDWLNESVTWTYLYNDSARGYFRNDGASFLYGMAAAVYATMGENPQAPALFRWFRHNWEEVLAALDIIGKGGASGEGNAYGASPTASGIIRTANLVWYANGEDLFASHDYFRQKLLFDAFGAYPGTIGGPSSPVPDGWPGNPIVEQASIGGDGRRGASWHSGALRPNGLMLSRRFAGTEEAAIWNWVYRQPAVDRVNDASETIWDLLYYSPRPELVKPSKLSHFDPSMGFAYIRSDWDSPDATWIAFWAGPHIDTHQHLDQGAFTVFKRRDLAPKTGHYDNDDVMSPHDLAYYTRTVSANTLLIADPAEYFNSFIAGHGCDQKGAGTRIRTLDGQDVCIPNDGGQRTMAPFGMSANNAEFFRTFSNAFDTAKVVSFSDDGQAVSLAADLTNAYSNPRHAAVGNSAKVRRVYRRLVYLREPDILLVADTVESTNPAFDKKWLLHALDRVEVDEGAGEAKVIVDDNDRSDGGQTTFDMRRGYAALLLKTVFPADFRYQLVGGRDASDTPHSPGHYHTHLQDFWVKDYNEGTLPNHLSTNWAPIKPIETYASAYQGVFGPGYGRWRLEVQPASGNTTDFFLHVMKPALDPGAAMPPVARVESGSEFGAEIESAGKLWRVWFAKDTLDAPRVETEAR